MPSFFAIEKIYTKYLNYQNPYRSDNNEVAIEWAKLLGQLWCEWNNSSSVAPDKLKIALSKSFKDYDGFA